METPFLLDLPSFEDHRGIFSPIPVQFNHKWDLRLRREWIQSNISINPKSGTFRGMHFQDPLPQSKLINVIEGSIIDFVVDLRPGDSFMDILWWNVDSDHALYVPKGFAHGFITTEPNTVVQYLVDEIWSKEYEDSINPFSIEPISERILELFDELEVPISDRDKGAQTIDEYIKKINHKN